MRYTAPARSDELRCRLRSQSRAQSRAPGAVAVEVAVAVAVDGGQCCLLRVNMSCWRPVGKARSGSWGQEVQVPPSCAQDMLRCYVLGTRYLMLASRVGNHFRPPAPASLQAANAADCSSSRWDTCGRGCVCARVRAGGRQCPDISLPHITISNVGTPPTADMVRPAAPPQLPCPMAIADARRHPCPGDRASALPCALPPRASLCGSREIIAPKLHGVASTILLIRVGVC